MKKTSLPRLLIKTTGLLLFFVLSYVTNLFGRNFLTPHSQNGKALDIEKVYADIPAAPAADAGAAAGGGGGDAGCGDAGGAGGGAGGGSGDAGGGGSDC